MGRHSLKFNKAFTIVEVLLVIVIIGVLASIAVVSYGGWKKSTIANQLKSDLIQAAGAMESAKNFSTGYPTTFPNVFTSSDGGSTSLVLSNGDTLTLYNPSTTGYCIDGASSQYPSDTYYIDSIGASKPVTGTCATRTTLPKPGTPTSLATATNTDTQVSLSWSAPDSYATSFPIQCATDIAFITSVVNATALSTDNHSVATPYVVSGLNSNTTYYCRVSAANNNGASTWSSSLSFTTNDSTLVAPATLTATSISKNQIDSSWSAVSGATQYQIQRATASTFAGGTISLDTTIPSSRTSYSSTSLSGGTFYYFRVRAINANGGTGNWSTTATSYTANDWMVYTMIASVGDWNGDGKNDIAGYKSDGSARIHLSQATNGTSFTAGYPLTNIGTNVESFIGIGKLPSATYPSLVWMNYDGNAYFVTSNGSTGMSGSATMIGSAGAWSSCDGIFALPVFVSGLTMIACKTAALVEYSLSSSGAPTLYTTFGSGWTTSYPGSQAFGGGDFVGNDGKGDIIAYTTAGACNTYKGLGNGTTNSLSNTCSSGWTNNYVTSGFDMNGDGIPDILRLSSANNALCLYNGNGSGAIGSGGACSITVN